MRMGSNAKIQETGLGGVKVGGVTGLHGIRTPPGGSFLLMIPWEDANNDVRQLAFSGKEPQKFLPKMRTTVKGTWSGRGGCTDLGAILCDSRS